MSKSGTWPGNVAVESLNNMDSAGSCDSVISTNSVWSEDSMEHLSAEEKACLVYLEETIEALEFLEDSGLSNDEPDAWSKMETQDKIRNVPNEMPDSGSPEMSRPTTYTAVDSPHSTLTTVCETEHRTANENSKPQSASTSAVGMRDVETKDLRVETDPEVSDIGYTTFSSGKTTTDSQLHGDPDHDNFTNSSDSSKIDVDIIPPPTDFMDEQEFYLPTVTITPVSPPANSFTKQNLTIDLEQTHLKPSLEKPTESFTALEDSQSKPSNVSFFVPKISPPPEFLEPRSPPAVAPKPKKLPSNIVLKSQKKPAHVSHENPVPTHSDRMLDPHKARIEALKKLGLLKDDKKESNPVISPTHPLKPAPYRVSHAGQSPPVSPATSHTPPFTPSHTLVNNPPPTFTPKQSVSPVAVLLSSDSASPHNQDGEILPVPADFSDHNGPSGNKLPAVARASFGAPPDGPPALMKHFTPPKKMGIKSATLERSGLGLSSQMFNENLFETADGKQEPKHVRNARPRPSSLGSGKDFSHVKDDDLVGSRPPDSRKPLPTQANAHRESGKLPRSQGISVLICPRPESEADRREALKKLGLLRD